MDCADVERDNVDDISDVSAPLRMFTWAHKGRTEVEEEEEA